MLVASTVFYGLRSRLILTLIACGLLSAPGTVLAQSSQVRQSGQLGQSQIRATQDRVDALSAQNAVPSFSIPPQLGNAQPSPAQQLMVFAVSRIDVEGSTVFDNATFEPLIAPYAGRRNTLAELRALAARIAEEYRAQGYPFTRVTLPGQQIVDGRVRLQVREFQVSSVVFDLAGRPVETPAALQPAVEAIRAERPVRLATLEAAQVEATRLPGLQVATTRFDETRDAGVRLTVFLVTPGERFVAIQPPTLRGAPAEEQRITVRSIRFDGNATISDAALGAEVADVIGREVALSDLRAVADRVAAHYAAAGYFGTAASVPAQVVRDGVVTLEVRELSIARVNVSLNGRSLPPDNMLSRIGNGVTAQQPTSISTVQRQLYTLRNTPGVLVESVIPPTIDNPDAEIYLRRRPITFTAALDNRGTSVSGPLQWGAMITTNDLLGLSEQFQLQTLSSIPLGQLRYIGGMVILPLTSNGLVGVFRASRSEAFPGGYLKPLDVAAMGASYSFGLNYPLITRPDFSVVATTSLDFFNNSSTVFGGQITASDERSRALRVGAMVNLRDGLGGQTNGQLMFSQGIDGLGARPSGNQVNTRPGMELNASKVVFEATRRQPLPGGFQVDTGLRVQRAFGPLPAAEVFTFGGSMYGRAYDSGIISGDHGIAGRVSLSRPTPTGNAIVPLLDPFVFYDIGQVSTALKTAGVASTSSAASAGVGLRFATGLGIGGSIEASQPLTHQPTVEVGKETRPLRVFFLLFMQF